MSVSAPAADVGVDRRASTARTNVWLLVSAACLVGETRLIDYGSEAEGLSAGGSLLLGLILLVLVRLRSRVARGIIVVLASTGAIIYVLTSTTVTGFLVAAFFAGEAGALLTPSVRRHVQSRRRRS